VIGSDPSNGMVTQAKSSTSADEYPNVGFVVASAESLPFLENKSVDMVVAAQAAHWFDYPKLFAELRRVMKSGGTLAFWGYKDHIFPSYPKASKLINEYAYGKDERLMGLYWEPGRFIVQNKLRAIKPPTEDWDDIQRIEYEPGTNGPKSGEGTCFMDKQMTLGQNMDYIRTWSAYHGWQEKHPDQKPKNKGGSGDLIDEMFEKMLESEEELRKEGDAWKDKMVDVEWGTALILARKK
jgi:trans-aconitate 3-methyltransferase